MKDFTTIELLECILTHDELMLKGEELARESQQKSRLEGEKKATVSSYSAKINACDAQIEILGLAISTKRESRNVDCEIKYNDPIQGQKTTCRIDTGEVVRISSMSREERSDMFINATGEQEAGFVFNDQSVFPIVEKDQLAPKDAETWKTLGQPMRAEDLVSAPIEKDKTYRVIKGEDIDGKIMFQLQRGLTKEEKPENMEPVSEALGKAEKAKADAKPPKKEKAPAKAKEPAKPKDKDPDPTDKKNNCLNCEGKGNKNREGICAGCEGYSHWQPIPTETKPEAPAEGAEADILSAVLKDNGITKGEAETFLQKEGHLGMTQTLDDNPFVVDWIRENLKTFIADVKRDLAGPEDKNVQF